MDYAITGYILMYILSVFVALLHHHRGDETLSISAGGYDQCAPGWCSIASLGPPYPVTCEEFIRAYHIVPVTIRIK